MKKILQIILLAFIATFADTSAQRLSPPNWTVNPALYQYSANVTSKIMVNNLPAPSGNNMLAAFVGNEIRGVATPLQFGNDFIYFLTVYTNNPADTVTLKAYIAQTDRILNIVERQAIVPNGVYGTVTSPVIFNAYDLNNNPPRLSGIPDQTIETGQQFAQFDLDNYLTELDGDQVTYSYSGNNNLTVSINSTTHVVTVTPNPSGWIGIDTMYFRVTDVNAAALFSEDTVVFRVRPVDNPPQISPIPNQKIGTNNSFSPVNLNNYVTTLDDDSIALSYEVDLTGSNDPWPNWSVNPSSFSQSMSLTAEVNAFGKPSSSAQRWIAAYSGNEVRGYGRAVQFGSKYLYFLTIYANAPGDTITFKYYDSTAKKLANVEQKIIFVNNSTIGTPSNPYLLNAGNILVAIDSRGIARFTVPNKTWTGTERIRFRVSDIGTSNNYFDTTTVSLTVFSDGAPVVSGIPDQTVQKGTPFTPFDLDDYLTEPDGQNVVWSYSGNSNLNVSINAQNVVTVTPVNPAWVGSESIIFRVTDVSPNALSTADTVIFRITPLDNAPVIGGIPDQVSQPNGLFPGVNLRDYVTELDGDSVSYSYTIDTPQPPDPSPSWSINTSAFEQTMTMTIEMSSLEVRPSGTAHKLAAFAGNEIRGVVSPILFNGKWLYFLTVYANAARENIRFKFFDATANKLLPVKQSVTFVPNGSFGSPTNPFQLDAGNIIFGLNGNILNAQVTDSSWSGEQYITVTARDALTPFQLSDTTKIKFRVPVPVNLPIAAPANLTGTAQINPNRIVLSWTDMSNNETGFVIQRKAGDSASANPYVILDTVGANIATFTDTDLLESFKYTYRVYGINQFVVSPFSNAFTITSPGNLPVPAAPVLASPANGAANQPTALNLVWNKSAGAVTYRVQLSTVNTFATTIINDSTLTDSVKAVSGLQLNTTYYWRVNAKNANGTGSYSTVYSFTTLPAVPAAPVLASPANGAANQPLALNLVWNKSAGAATYRVQVSTVNTFATTIVNDSTITDSVRAISGLSNNTTYYWRVNAKNATGTSTYSTVFSFTTQPAVPAAPVLASPANGAVNQPLGLNLVWNKSAGAATYRVQVSTVNTFATTIVNDSTITDSVRAISGLQNNTTYYWRVNAKNASGTSTYSTVYSFTTQPTVPAAPVLASPANGAVNQPLGLNLVWNKSAGAATYRVQLSTVNTFATTIINDSTITDSVRAISGLLNNTTYYWRVNAKNATGTSSYSTVYSFTTLPAVPAAPVLASPANGAVNQPLALNLVWNKSAGAATYRVQVSTVNTFATTIVDDSTLTDSVKAVSGLSNNTTYYWRVNAKNATGTSTYSTVYSFTTQPAVPAAPVLASPANGATGQPLALNLVWNKSAGAATYRVQLSTTNTFATTILNDSTITDSVRAITGLLNNTTYYWRVNAKNATGTSTYSTVYSFTTQLAVPAAPVLASPANGAVNQPLALNLVWNKSAGAATYRVQVSTVNTFATTIVDDSTITDSVRAISGLLNNTTYYWRVNAKNATGTSTYSTVYSFTTQPAVPAAPVLASPANGAVNQPLAPNLIWNKSAGAATYRVQVSTVNTFATTIVNDSTVTDSVRAISGLLNNTTYYWRVNAKNATGTSTYSTVYSFTTQPAVPAAPVLASPANGATGQPLALNLVWNKSAGAATYRVQVSTVNTFATTILNDSTITDSVRAISGLLNNTTYYWRVNAKNASGTSTYSTVYSFTTLPAVPAAPVLASPANGATGQPLALNLVWNKSAGAASYRVQVSTVNTFATTILNDSTITDSVRAISGLLNNTTYYWRVNAKNATGTSTYSTVYSFTTQPAVPAAPVLASPANGAANQPLALNLVWNKSAGAATYRVQVSTVNTFATTIVNDSTITDSVRAISGLSNNTTYYWRVNAKNATGTSAYSTVFSFTTQPAVPAAPVLASPANGATGQPLALNLVWNKSAGAATYRVQLSTVNTFATTIINDSTITDSVRAISGLLNNTTYYWRVNAKNATGTSSYSTVYSFTTQPAVPAAPVLASPANGAVNQPLALNLVWNKSAGAASYRLQLSTTNTFATTIVNDSTITDSIRAISGLLNNTTYYWRVNAKNATGTSTYSTVFSFTTQPAVPAAPVLASPANGAVNQPLALNLVWNKSAGAVTYRVQLSTTNTFATTIINDSTITDSLRAISGLSNNTTYYWRINAKNAGGTSTYSTVYSFTTQPAVPAAPVLASPANGAVNQPLALNLVWNKSAGAATYRVQVSTVNTFATTILNDSTVTDSLKALSGLSNNTTYYWRVNAKNATGTSTYSTVFSFTTQPAVPAAPVLASPANGATNQPLALNLVWNKSAGAATYRVQVSTVNTFATTILNDSTVTDSLKALSGLSNNTTYYWRVNAKNAGGTSTYSTVYSFTTLPAVPAAPVLASPANGATGQPLALNLVWNKSAGAASYRVQLSTTNTFATTIVNDSTITDSVRAISGLLNNTTYYWRVNAKNASGTSTYSTVYSFTTQPAVPAAPVLASPANGAVNQPLALNLVWNKSAGAATYRVQVSTVNTFATTIVNDSTVTDSVKAISGLLNNTTYYWRVNAKNATGTSTYSTVFSFTTQPAVPAAPVLASPANGAVNQPLALNLVWNKSAGAATYRVQVSTVNTFATTIVNDSTVTDSVKAISGLLNNTTYYWRVNAKNATGTSSYSTVFSFTTLPAVPAAPVLASPSNGATGQPLALTLRWNKSAGAATYRVQVSTVNTFATTIVNDSTVTDSLKAISGLNNNTTYYWRVNAKNAGGTSAYSTVFSFTTQAGVPPAPVLASPANGATGQPLALTLRWNKSAGAATYRVQVSTVNTFATTIVNDSTVTDSVKAISGLLNNTTYYWRVNAKNASGTSSYSTVFSFTTLPAVPAAPVLASPANGATGQPLALTLRWNKSAGAATYRVQVSTVNTFATTIVNDSTVTDSVKAISGLLNNTTYYWRVNAKNVSGTSAYSAIFSFTTQVAAPPVPVLVSPSNAATNQPTALTLRWNKSAGAATYRVQVSTVNTFATTIVNDSTVTDSLKAISGLLNNTTYYWRVNAKNASGTSAYSTVFSFRTQIAAPSAPVLASPANGALNQPVALSLKWNKSAGAATYRVQLSPDSTFATTVVDDSTLTDSLKAVTGLANFTNYYWRVSAKNATGTSQWSSVWRFRTIVRPINAPSNLNAVNIVPGKVKLTWNDNSDNEVGFIILRKKTNSSGPDSIYKRIDTVLANVTMYTDSTVGDSIAYKYRVFAYNTQTQSDSSNEASITTLSDVEELAGGLMPQDCYLNQNYPNPFNPSTSIRFGLPKEEHIEIIIFSISGQKVRELTSEILPGGNYEVMWDGRNDNGEVVPTGIYLLRMHTPSFTQIRKMVMLK